MPQRWSQDRRQTYGTPKPQIRLVVLGAHENACLDRLRRVSRYDRSDGCFSSLDPL